MSQPAELGSPRELGVIHDIGFRHYTGPRLGRGYLLRSLYGDSLKGAFGLGRSAKSKVLPFLMLGVMVVPALFVTIIAGVNHDDKLGVDYTQYASRLWLPIAIFLAAQAPASVSRDLRFRVMPLYFSRPLSRNDYVLAKYAAMASAMFILIAAPLVVLYAGAVLGKLPLWAQTRGVLQSVVGAVIFAVVLSVIGLLIASITPKRGFGVAAIVCVLLVLNISSAIAQQLAHDNGRPKLSGYLGAISPISLVDGIQVWLFGSAPAGPEGPPGTLGGIVFVLISLALIASCYGLLLLRYRKVSAS
jgi:ABC-2 type transport system permease protein